MLDKFIEQVNDAKPLSVVEVRGEFFRLSDKQVFDCLVALNDGSKRIFKINTPVLDGLDDEQAAFINSYIHAEVESMLKVIGSKDVTVCFDSSGSLGSFAKQMEELFCIRKNVSKNKKPSVIEVSTKLLDIKYADRSQFIKEKTICGFCITSAGIKGAMVSGGNLCCLKEYAWPDEKIKQAKQYCDIVYMLIRLMRVQVSLNVDSGSLSPEDRILYQQDLTGAMQKDASYEQIESIVKVMEKELKGKLVDIDAVGLSFPDAELKDKVLTVAETPGSITLYKAAEDIFDSELIAQLEEHREVSAMQFSNAIAAVYYANLSLLAK